MMREYLIGIRVAFPDNVSNPDEVVQHFAAQLSEHLDAREGQVLDPLAENFDFKVLSVNIAIPLEVK